MATKSISQLDTQATANETDLFEVAIVDANSASGYASKKESAAAIADAIVGEYQYPLRITGTTAKTIAGAINELKNLVDLLPQFAIEVVQALPVSDISETTIYLVPAQDPEQGNYYEEYIYVNNAWELVGTTAVDLSGYYTSAQVDTLLAGKANTSSLATVATSGAYSDLSGKPTIDTALDDASTNAVENRAVAGEINSIKSDITVEGSASGDIATFIDGSDNPLKELKISIVAQQSGSGDPSPTNVRPITGWTGAIVQRVEENLIDVSQFFPLERTTINNIDVTTGKIAFTSTATYYGARLRIPIQKFAGRKLAFSAIFPSAPKRVEIKIFDASNTNILSITLENNESTIINVPSTAVVFQITLSNVTTTNTQIVYDNLCLMVADTVSQFVPYKGQTYLITFPTEAGTVYGGTLNVLMGVLTVNYVSVDMGQTNFSYNSTNQYFFKIVNGIKTPSNNNVIANIISPIYKSKSANSIIQGVVDLSIGVTSDGYVIVKDSNYTSSSDFNTAISGIQLVYEIATPITYQLTPTEVRSLLGQNNIWADCGAITELKYTRDLNLCINDIIARIEALEGGSNSRSLSVSPTFTKSLTSDSDTTEGKTEETEEETKEEAQNER